MSSETEGIDINRTIEKDELAEKLHPIFTKDPAELMQYVYKEVCVTTSDQNIHTGWVYTIDPVSETIALVQFRNDSNNSVKMVMGHAVTSIIVMNEDTNVHREQLDSLFKPKGQKHLSPEELKESREKVRIWLCKNRIPVEVSGSNSELLTVSNALVIEPPYGAENCNSTNEIILGRIQGLLKSMPPDVTEW